MHLYIASFSSWCLKVSFFRIIKESFQSPPDTEKAETPPSFIPRFFSSTHNSRHLQESTQPTLRRPEMNFHRQITLYHKFKRKASEDYKFLCDVFQGEGESESDVRKLNENHFLINFLFAFNLLAFPKELAWIAERKRINEVKDIFSPPFIGLPSLCTLDSISIFLKNEKTFLP